METELTLSLRRRENMPNCVSSKCSMIRSPKTVKAHQDDESTEEGIANMKGRYLELHTIPISTTFFS